MKAHQLKEQILSCITDICFDYNGKSACINPWNHHKFEVGYGEQVETFSNIEDLMSAKIFDGYSLNDICETVDFQLI